MWSLTGEKQLQTLTWNKGEGNRSSMVEDGSTKPIYSWVLISILVYVSVVMYLVVPCLYVKYLRYPQSEDLIAAPLVTSFSVR